MSGPEWTTIDDDEPDRRDDAEPLSRQAGFDHDHDSEPAMDHDHDDSPDRDEPAPLAPSVATNADAEVPPSPERPNFVGMILSLATKIPQAWLGTERHEILPVAPSSAQAEGVAPAGPERVPPRFKLLIMKHETRVGLVALVSFVVVVAAFIANRGWTGKSVMMALNQSGNAEPEPATPSTGKIEPTKDADKKQDKQKKPATSEANKLPESTPATTAGNEPTLGRGPTGGDHLPRPPATAEGSVSPVLASSSPTTTPPQAPEAGLPPKPPEPPPAATDPIPLPSDSMPPALPAPNLEPTATVPDAKPKETEINPAPAPPPAAVTTPAPDTAPANSLPALNDLPSPGETTQASPPVTEPAPPPTSAPAPVAPVLTQNPPTPAPTPVASTGPVPTQKPPTLEMVPAGSVESAATKASTAGAIGNWMVIPSGGRRLIGAIPIISTPAEAQGDPPRIADGPRFTDDLTTADQVEPVVHVVQPGENFWTISRLFYRSPRFYKALHAANRKQVPDIAELYVGTVLRIPPPEALDRSLIDPPSRSNTDDPATSTINRTSKRADSAEEADLAMPARPRPIRPDPEAVETPRRPTYKVKPHETLRSIARDTLNDSKRDREIYNLNRDVLDDINVCPPGTLLTLPTDATVGRRAAR